MNSEDPRQPGHKVIGLWLLGVCAMVFVMVVLGGLTRLTHSGLSMVEWKPLTGWLPPMSEAVWQELFDKYRATPEYKKLNAGMTLAEFESIFWLEFVHRVWGRLIGIFVAVPMVFFALKRWLDRRLGLKLVGLFVLGGLQGGLGWFMVMSGLVDDPNVSPYRLTAHLGLALAIYGLAFWWALDLLRGYRRESGERIARRAAIGLCALIFTTILSGGFVAGNDAGLTYNTFPLMDGRWVPPGLFEMTPFYRNFFENLATVQFDHRVLAITTFCLVVIFWLWGRNRITAPGTRRLLAGLVVAVLLQVSLGITTLLLAVPLIPAALHQAVAIGVFTLSLWLCHDLRR
ncbi:MAG: COX15/CtaA family protein [Rhodospirillales bacterium]